MTATRARRLAHGVWFATAGLWLGTIVLVLTASPQVGHDLPILLIGAIPMAIYGSVGALVARTRPENPIGWLLAWVALAVALWMFGLSYAQVGFDPGDTLGELPGAALMAWLGVLALPSATPAVLPLLLLVFPDGHLRSKRWRPVLWLAALGGGFLVFGALWIPWELDPVKLSPVLGGSGNTGTFTLIGFFAVIVASFLGLFSLTLRYRAADAEAKQPMRLLVGVLLAMAISTATGVIVSLIPGLPEAVFLVVVLALIVDGLGILFGIPLAAAAAVLTFGLYDVGVVVKKTVVYVALVVVFLGALALIAFVFNPLNLVSSGGVSNETEQTIVRVMATASVVIVVLVLAFRPVKRLAYRLVYGRRATPYEAMSEFSERLGEAYSTDDVLPRMASILRESTGAAVARVWLEVAGELRPVAAAPSTADPGTSLHVHGDALPSMDGLRAFPVRDRGELLGALTVEMPPAEPLSKTGEQLVVDMASRAGLVLRNVRLVEELQESRRRIVAAQDERARKLERDLHDGAQQQLVALSVKLGLVEQIAGRDPSKVPPLVAQAKIETLEALDTLRDLARGIYPPLLRDQGLAAALDAQARKAPIATTLESDATDRFGPEIESAVYFCCLEAMQNIAKYANASSATIRLAQTNGDLTFEVTDDGAGFDPAGAHGSGLTNMRDRLEALGGSLRIRSQPGAGTAISGSVPVEVTA